MLFLDNSSLALLRWQIYYLTPRCPFHRFTSFSVIFSFECDEQMERKAGRDTKNPIAIYETFSDE